MPGPRIAVALTNPAGRAEPATAALKNARYLEAVERAGGVAIPIDERTSAGERSMLLGTMDGLLLTGGADIEPQRYGEAPAGAHGIEPERDALDGEAFALAMARGVPVLGICRGLQAINVFSGGRLVQHVEGHESGPWPAAADAARRHELRLVPGSRLSRVLGTATSLEVNSFHHQAVDRAGVAPTLRVAGTSPGAQGELVEALEAADADRWVVAVQCHPERTESTPAALQKLWTAFVAACAAPAGRSSRGGR
jgi:putative glutamine amidotransferase